MQGKNIKGIVNDDDKAVAHAENKQEVLTTRGTPLPRLPLVSLPRQF